MKDHSSVWRVLLLTLVTAVTLQSEVVHAAENQGTLPLNANGRPLNLDFEKGTLEDWTAEGTAFEGQPIKGDTIFARRNDMKSSHQGDYWIGTYEVHGDQARGTLTSVPFQVTHPYASFLIGGGSANGTKFEVFKSNPETLIFQARGTNHEELRPAVLDLQKHLGQKIFIRLTDNQGTGWGHINFDNFRFHESEPKFDKAKLLKPDEYEHAGLTPQDAASVMSLPEGFKALLGAGEPDVKQPIAMALDDRGRLWVAEAYEYPRRAKGDQGRDRILIFEDQDGDGYLETRKVFAEGLNLVSGLEVGFGGVFVGAAPYLLFIADHDQDDRADGPPEILLDGWGYEDTHETLNTFIWGPDGWLYGNHGIFTHSNVGVPGAANHERQRINAGIWRYHPVHKKFEIFAHGTSNPWGVDFNDYGDAFATACVIPHLYHMVQNGRYIRQAGNHFNPHTYADIQTIADHLHYVGDNPHRGNLMSDSMGGGHAHAGAMIYLGGSWPEEYRNQIFMNNIHGQRVNVDHLEPQGSTYVGKHRPDFLMTNDRWSQMLNLRYGPDGQVWIIDWYDDNACHHNNIDGHDRSNGRIFKIVYNNTPHVTVDLKQLSDAELVELQLHANDWYVRHARRLLQERASANKLSADITPRLREIAASHQDPTRRLRALWALQVIGQLSSEVTDQGLLDQNPHVRGWIIRLLAENHQNNLTPELLSRFKELAANDNSPVVRRNLASLLQDLPVENRWEILDHLLAHTDDARDPKLPLLYWYAFEPLCEADASRALSLAVKHGKAFSQLQNFAVRRIGNPSQPESLARLIEAVAGNDDPGVQLVILRGINQALVGTRSLDALPNWESVFARLRQSTSQEVLLEAFALGLTFGDTTASGELQKLLENSNNPAELRRSALAALIKARVDALPLVLPKLVSDQAIRADVLRAMATVNDPAVPASIFEIYSSLLLEDRRIALATLASRLEYARSLIEKIQAKQIPASDLSADLVRQLINLGDDNLTAQIEQLWAVRETAADKQAQIEQYKAMLSGPESALADLSAGRAIFAKACQQCHVLYGEGGSVGPDLTGSHRANLDYLLSNIVDPSAVMANEYLPSLLVLEDGRVITGIIKSQSDTHLTIQTATDMIVIPADEVEQRRLGSLSMMPEDILKPLADQEIRDLIAYLQSPTQVDLPEKTSSSEDASTSARSLDFPSSSSEANASNIRFKKTEIDATFRSEGVAVGDFNGDGLLDIAAGSVWYAAPDWKMHVIREKADAWDPHSYSNSFCNYATDVNGDGLTDLIVVDFPGAQTWWFENPGKDKLDQPWKRHEITPVTNNESPGYLNLTGGPHKQLLIGVNPNTANPDSDDRYLAFLTPKSDPYAPWSISRISPNAAPGTKKYSHGIGAGDVNGDGFNDILVTEGWWESPGVNPDGTLKHNGPWKFHPANFGKDTAHIHVYDFDGDGDNDVVSSSAHMLGIWWHEQTPDGWKTHHISDELSQTHALLLADINGDGLPDLVTGKRFWAHGPHGDVNPGDPAVIVWFELQRKDGQVHWVKHQIDDDSGIGTQFEVVDVNGDGLLDVVTSNKKGVYYFEQVRD